MPSCPDGTLQAWVEVMNDWEQRRQRQPMAPRGCRRAPGRPYGPSCCQRLDGLALMTRPDLWGWTCSAPWCCTTQTPQVPPKPTSGGSSRLLPELHRLLTPTLSPWATPGQPGPDVAEMAGPEDLAPASCPQATWTAPTSSSLNCATPAPAVLDGGPRTGDLFHQRLQATITNLRIEPGSSVTLSADANGLVDLWDGEVVNMTDHLSAAVFLNDDGGAVRLRHRWERLRTPWCGVMARSTWTGGAAFRSCPSRDWTTSSTSAVTAADKAPTPTPPKIGNSDGRALAQPPCVDGTVSDLTDMRPLIAPEAACWTSCAGSTTPRRPSTSTSTRCTNQTSCMPSFERLSVAWRFVWSWCGRLVVDLV